MREAPEIDPVSRWALRLAGVLALLVILVALNAMLRGGEENPFDPNPIAAAAEQTRALQGAHMTMSATMAAAGETMTMSGSGAFAADGRSEMRVTMQAPPPVGSVEVEMIGTEQLLYVRSPLFSTGTLPAGKEWLAADPTLASEEYDVLAEGSDPWEQLEMLRAARGTVVELAPERVRGAMTRRYRGTIDFDSYADILRSEGDDDAADQLDEIGNGATGSVEAWIDRQGRLHRARVVTGFVLEPEAPAVTMDMQMELYDFGAEPAIRLPDPDTVLDITEVGGGIPGLG